MSVLSIAQRRCRTVLSVFFFLLVAGGYAFFAIPKESDPDISIPVFYVPLVHEGISPEDAEKLLIRPLEVEMRSLEGLKELRSTARQGSASVVTEFYAGSDLGKALRDVREKLDLVKSDLPADAEEPSVYEINLSRFPVLNISLYGEVSYRVLDKLGRDLRDEIRALPNVLDVDLVGAREEVIEVVISPVLLEAYNLQAQTILQSLRDANLLIAAGSLKQDGGEFAIEVAGRLRRAADLLALPLLTSGEGVVRVRDVAQVRRTFKDDLGISRVNGISSLTLLVKKRTGRNLIETVDQVRAVVRAAQDSMPQAVQVVIGQDESRRIRGTLKDLTNNITSAILLVMVVILGTLGFRSGLLVGLAIPGSFLTAILMLFLFGFTINIVVLFALILSVGMLVDGAIVVSEYATRKHSQGYSLQRAFGEAGERMALPIIASTLTTLAAFLPLVFWPGIVGEFMKYLPLTVLLTLSASLLMALIFLPVLGTHLRTIGEIVLTLMAVVGAYMIAFKLGGLFSGGFAVLLGLGAAGGAFYGVRRLRRYIFAARTDTPTDSVTVPVIADSHILPRHGFSGLYIRFLQWVLHHAGKVLSLAGAFLVLAYVAYGQLGKGVEFFPHIEPDSFIVGVSTRGNLSLPEKARLLGEVESHILALQRERHEFRMIMTRVGGDPGSGGDERQDSIGEVTLELGDWRTRRKAHVIISDLQARMGEIAGVRLEFAEDRDGPPADVPVHVRISGEDRQIIAAAARRVRGFMARDARFVDIEDSLPSPAVVWALEVDRAQASKFGVDVQTLGSFVKLVTQGLKITDIHPDNSSEEVDIVVRFPKDTRSLEQLEQLRINTPQGSVPVGQFLTRTAKPESGTLLRVDGRNIHYVKADVAEGVLSDTLSRELRTWLAAEADSLGPVDISLQGEERDRQEAQAFLMKAFAVALFIMAAVLLTQFNNFYNVMLILAAVIMSTAGVLIGLIITAQPFGIIMCGIGVIALAGIVVNNNIVLIDTYERYAKSGMSVRQAVLTAAAERLRPVLLTTITTILGLLPLTFKANVDFLAPVIEIGAPSTQWWTQLATAIVFGLTFATCLTLIVTPSALMLRERLGLLPQPQPEI